ncbi:hypothetical protein FB384_001878 [Prauserella sediminis]|uniref:Uncharacterized protein n=1 Tax=Prauserella sediminis TaxID=577680 RepID=A0A839XNC0_9PSEU|nr:twin-arginine translocation signal domain-containing protein [Prauserella sediminis]MBB3662974.1 hypothetical protein [Prauserella sediminis]
MRNPPESDRRTFLARLGLLGAVAGISVTVPGIARSASGPSLDVIGTALGEVARDTLNALAVFVVPGPDAYSKAQGTPHPEPGALEAKAPDFLIESLDSFVPFPDQLANPIGAALAGGLADVPLDLPGDLPSVPVELDSAVRTLLSNDEHLPLSLVIALLLNNLATQVNPAAASGAFLSPFARLTFNEKADAFRQLEEPNAELVAAIDQQVNEPLKGSVSGMLKFVAGALLEFSAFGTYCEWAKFDPATRYVTGTPVGWDLSKYDPGVMDGWDEFKGYYQGRTKVSAK